MSKKIRTHWHDTPYEFLPDITIADSFGILMNLINENWDDLPDSTKRITAQRIADIERTFFGLLHGLTVVFKDLPREELWGAYDREKQEIVLNIRVLTEAGPEELCRCICHEARHAYQHEVIERVYKPADGHIRKLLQFCDVGFWALEFDEPDLGGTEEEKAARYRSRRIEIDARRYAEDAVKDYFKRIKEHFEGNREIKRGWEPRTIFK